MNMRLVSLGVAILVSAVAIAQEEPRQMTAGGFRDLDPVISPDGNKLAFSSNRTGNFDIYVFDYKTSGTYQLTESPKDDRYPAWSPDSKRVLFTSRRTGNGDVFEVSATDRSGALQLTDQDTLEEYASYSGDGGMVLMARSVKRGLLRREMNVVTVPRTSAGSTGNILTEGDEPRFSPDGKYIVFVSRRTKNNDIWRMTTSGTLQTQLTSSPKDDENPCFSPDGKQIVFTSNRTGNFDIYVMDADGSNVRQLTSHDDHETQPCWSRENYIYYVRKTSENVSNIWRIKAP